MRDVQMELRALAGQCAIGYGTELARNPEIHVPPELERRVFLTPEDPPAQHPLLCELEPNTVYRSTLDWRSFSMVTQAGDSLTVKGGDFAYAQIVARSFGHYALANRIWNRQIPGGCERQPNLHEFDAGMTLQAMARAALGRQVHTATPYRVMAIEEIETPSGRLPIRDYLNNPELYFKLDPGLRRLARLNKAEPLGDALIDRYNLTPSQYLYHTPGPNIRVDDLCGSRYFRETDEPDSGGSYRIPFDLLERYVSDMTERGEFIAPHEGRKNAMMRAIYQLLGRSYQFDAAEVLPMVPIDDTNYTTEFQAIPDRCQTKGITSRVLTTFVDRITEVAALAHAHEHAFSRAEGIGGSFMPRNVTYEGAVLDLDTFGPFTREPQHHFEQDMRELGLSVACLRRVVAISGLPNLAEQIQQSYLTKLAEFGALPSIQRTARNTLERSHDFNYVLNIL